MSAGERNPSMPEVIILRVQRTQRALWVLLLVAALGFPLAVALGWGQADAGGREDSVLRELRSYGSGTREQDQVTFKPAWGRPGGADTLVLYDTELYGRAVSKAELDGIMAGNLASHFGAVRSEPMADYTLGLMRGFDAVVYVGTSETQVIPRAFYDDVIGADTPVLWAGANIGEFDGSDPDLASRFEQTYGWDPASSGTTGEDAIKGVTYHGQRLTREGQVEPIRVPRITAVGQVEVLATTTEEVPRPWAIRSGNLTYVGEVPLEATEDTDRYLAFADLYYDLLANETEPVKSAALRVSHVDPGTDPDDLQEVANYLFERGIPFQVAVTPIRVSSTDTADAVELRAATLSQSPGLVRVLEYVESRGAATVQHGTTHQYGRLANPYDGTSGPDAEFYRAQCSATPVRPFQIQPCRDETYVVGTGPVGGDDVGEWVKRLELGRSGFRDAGLRVPTIFETPFDTASPNAYLAMTEVYDSRYERSWYFAGQLSGDAISYDEARSQFFPYSVHDLYGQVVLPDNVAGLEQSSRDERRPQDVIDAARANLSVRESVASFTFDTSLGLDDLRTVVDGVEGLGYSFVPVTELE